MPLLHYRNIFFSKSFPKKRTEDEILDFRHHEASDTVINDQII